MESPHKDSKPDACVCVCVWKNWVEEVHSSAQSVVLH